MSDEMEWRLKSDTRVPSGGWYYRCPKTGWILPRTTGGSLSDKVHEVMDHNLANAALGLELEAGKIYRAIHDQTVAHIRSLGIPTEDLYQVPKAKALAGRRSQLGPKSITAHVAEAVQNDALGAKIIANWFGSGMNPVSPATAERRASICQTCPMNTGEHRPVTGKIAEVVRWVAEFRNKVNLRVKDEERFLGTCSVCGCHLPTKVWVPITTIQEDQEHIYPSECWINQECDPGFANLERFSHTQEGDEPPPIGGQTPWKSGIIEIPNTDGEYWFNGGLLKRDDGLWLASRRMTYPHYSASITFCKLDADMKTGERIPIGHTTSFADEHLEDGRCIPIPGDPDNFLLAASNFFLSSKQTQGLFLVGRDFSVKRKIRIDFAGNGPSIDTQRWTEKNWQFFYVGQRLHFVHWISPDHVVCELERDSVQSVHVTKMPFMWPYGRPCGGTPPVEVDGLYWSFFHSFQLFTQNHRRYFAGAYAFDTKPPYTIRRFSRIPFLAGTKAHPVSLWHHLVVFPTGAIFDPETREWLMTMGVNDCRNAWIRIPHSELERTLQ